ncbi:MAG: hypothetical protein K6B41_04235 [Butyrivibrio sp.]|nr:hypothetical protein [Butyrivibrio sp.]
MQEDRKDYNFVPIIKNIVKANWFKDPDKVAIMLKILEKVWYMEESVNVKVGDFGKEVKKSRGEYYGSINDIFDELHMSCSKRTFFKQKLKELEQEGVLSFSDLNGEKIDVEVSDTDRRNDIKIVCLKYEDYVHTNQHEAFFKYIRGSFDRLYKTEKHSSYKMEMIRMYLYLLLKNAGKGNDEKTYINTAGLENIAYDLCIGEAKVKRIKNALDDANLLKSKRRMRPMTSIITIYYGDEEYCYGDATLRYTDAEIINVLKRAGYEDDVAEKAKDKFRRETAGVNYFSQVEYEKDILGCASEEENEFVMPVEENCEVTEKEIEDFIKEKGLETIYVDNVLKAIKEGKANSNTWKKMIVNWEKKTQKNNFNNNDKIMGKKKRSESAEQCAKKIKSSNKRRRMRAREYNKKNDNKNSNEDK